MQADPDELLGAADGGFAPLAGLVPPPRRALLVSTVGVGLFILLVLIRRRRRASDP